MRLKIEPITAGGARLGSLGDPDLEVRTWLHGCRSGWSRPDNGASAGASGLGSQSCSCWSDWSEGVGVGGVPGRHNKYKPGRAERNLEEKKGLSSHPMLQVFLFGSQDQIWEQKQQQAANRRRRLGFYCLFQGSLEHQSGLRLLL